MPTKPQDLFQHIQWRPIDNGPLSVSHRGPLRWARRTAWGLSSSFPQSLSFSPSTSSLSHPPPRLLSRPLPPQMCLFMCNAKWSDREKHLRVKETRFRWCMVRLYQGSLIYRGLFYMVCSPAYTLLTLEYRFSFLNLMQNVECFLICKSLWIKASA